MIAVALAPGLWSRAAFVLAVVGVAASTVVVLAFDTDPSRVLWPLVLTPVALALVPVLVVRPGARLGAVLGLGAWCVLTAATIGVLLLPALAAEIVAVLREGR